MAIVNQFTDMSGKIRIVWQMSNGESIMVNFNTQPTTLELEEIEAKYIEEHLYDTTDKLQITIIEDLDLLKSFISEIKNHPTVTLTQFNNWLSTKEWYEDAQIRIFIFKLAQRLADYKELDITDFTQSQILQKIRDWIVSTPIKKISKLIFGNIETIGEL